MSRDCPPVTRSTSGCGRGFTAGAVAGHPILDEHGRPCRLPATMAQSLRHAEEERRGGGGGHRGRGGAIGRSRRRSPQRAPRKESWELVAELVFPTSERPVQPTLAFCAPAHPGHTRECGCAAGQCRGVGKTPMDQSSCFPSLRCFGTTEAYETEHAAEGGKEGEFEENSCPRPLPFRIRGARRG